MRSPELHHALLNPWAGKAMAARSYTDPTVSPGMSPCQEDELLWLHDLEAQITLMGWQKTPWQAPS